MNAKKKDLPGWFPFALASTAVVLLYAGARSRWTLSRDQPEPGVRGTPYRIYWP